MNRTTLSLLTIALGFSAMSPLPALAQAPKGGGAVFVMTNSVERNQVIAYARDANGALTGGERFDTGGRGSGGQTAPFASQGSITLSQDHTLLFAVNAGSGTISVFGVFGSALRLIDETLSGGSEPVAVAQQGSLVYVLNAGGQGSVVGFRLDNHGRLVQIDNSQVFLTTFAGNSGGSSLSFSPDGHYLLVTERVAGHVDRSEERRVGKECLE